MNDLNITDLTNQAKSSQPKITTEENAKKLSSKLTELDRQSLEKAVSDKAQTLEVPYLDLKGFPISPTAIALIPQEQAETFNVVCFFYSGNELRLGSTNPENPQLRKLAQEMSAKYHVNVEIYLISENSLELGLKLYEKIPKIKEVKGGVEITEADLKKFQEQLTSFEELQKLVTEVSMTDLVTLILASAFKAEASDVHIEAEEKNIKIRFRIDGILHSVSTLPSENWPKVISRIKLLAGLKLNITAQPQDGRFTIYLTNDRIDVRVSTIPTAYGESVVMRLLRASSSSLQFEDLGIRGKSFVDLKHEIKRPNGMIIATGPTGSGKTTTLYAILSKLNNPETKIITLEDPIEYKLEGVNQSQIDHSKEYSFAKGLRSILRQDPDIVMVGEMRDLETADVSINAALTGHLVISTIHTNSASGAIPRFLAMGVKPFLLSPALNAIIGQRLVRRLCEHCKVEAKVDSDTMTKVLNILSQIPVKSAERLEDKELNNLTFYTSQGCDQCHNLGYKGRIGIYEIMTMNAEIEKIILSGKVSEYEIQEIAVKSGMVTMVQDGLLKAKDGITSIEEVFRKTE